MTYNVFGGTLNLVQLRLNNLVMKHEVMFLCLTICLFLVILCFAFCNFVSVNFLYLFV